MRRASVILKMFSILILSVLSSACPAQTDASKQAGVNVQSVQKQAEHAFKVHTQNRIGKYTLSTPKDEGQHWSVFVKGAAEFARPGNHWIVKIDKGSGRTEVVPGE
jgi:hypothetical protein